MSAHEIPEQQVVPGFSLTDVEREMASHAFEKDSTLEEKFKDMSAGKVLKMRIPPAERNSTMAALKVRAEEKGLIVRDFKGNNEDYEFSFEKAA